MTPRPRSSGCPPFVNRTTGGRPRTSGRRASLRYDRRVIELRSRDEIEAMRPAGRFVAAVLSELAERTRVGVNVLELDRIAHAMIRERGATSCYIDYHPSFGAMPFGKVLCVSINDAVLHGLPSDRRLRDGDLV